MFRTFTPALLASSVLVTALPVAALAHATLEQKTVAAGATSKITLRVPHGCDGEATHTVRVTLPEGVYAAKPMPKAGWEMTLETGAYATPFDNHGTMMTEGLREVTWSGGHLEDGWYDEFVLRGTFGPGLAPGSVLYFPAMQECANGVADWTDTSGSHDVPNPAPNLTITAADRAHGHGHGHGHGAAESEAGDDHSKHKGHGHDDHAGNDHAGHDHGDAITLGDLTITGAYSRATLPNAPVGGGFFTVANTGAQADRLVSVSSPVAGRAEIHEMAMEGDVMRMRALPDGLEIPAEGTVTLKPGGFHLMLMDLKDRLIEGETLTVTLTFEQAGAVDILLPIGAPNAKGHAGHDH
ncbi:DUF1775 domain-containing protein [Pseudooceanicola aestuarii]|uniref:DUF1775 domain-containing protein n=1 Tax=Pseudooceanicola aestuarii TaxID=2697319 RepID=UPI0013D337A3|nr:DUF1775 domain-containing protein [Pseudooceanicola aestuarii]